MSNIVMCVSHQSRSIVNVCVCVRVRWFRVIFRLFLIYQLKLPGRDTIIAHIDTRTYGGANVCNNDDISFIYMYIYNVDDDVDDNEIEGSHIITQHTHTQIYYMWASYKNIYIFIHIHPSWDADNTRKRLGQYIYIYAINICFYFLSPRKYTKHKADVSPPRRRSPIDNLELISWTRRRLTLQRDIARSRREYLCYFVCTADFVDCIIIYAHYMWELNKLLSHFAAKWSTLRISTQTITDSRHSALRIR